jgi:peptidyl-prolyl cis-trans isomerase SurA
MKLMLSALIENEVMLQIAVIENITIPDDELDAVIDAAMSDARRNFASEQAFIDTLRANGFASLNEFRSYNEDLLKRRELPERLVAQLRQSGRLPAATVPDSQVDAAVAVQKARLLPKPATVSFRQVLIPTRPSAAARLAARAKAESLLALVLKGADFDSLARRESMDTLSAPLGGDLDWQRRGKFVAEFERWMFALEPGQVSPVIETGFGFHIVKVDRKRPAEVRARHIRIIPKFESSDTTVARARADSAYTRLKAGVTFDSVASMYNDPTANPNPSWPNYQIDSLPPEYAAAFNGIATDSVAPPFATQDVRNGMPAYVVAVITGRSEGGPYTDDEVRELIRRNLQGVAAVRAYLEKMRKQMYIKVFN